MCVRNVLCWRVCSMTHRVQCVEEKSTILLMPLSDVSYRDDQRTEFRKRVRACHPKITSKKDRDGSCKNCIFLHFPRTTSVHDLRLFTAGVHFLRRRAARGAAEGLRCWHTRYSRSVPDMAKRVHMLQNQIQENNDHSTLYLQGGSCS